MTIVAGQAWAQRFAARAGTGGGDGLATILTLGSATDKISSPAASPTRRRSPARRSRGSCASLWRRATPSAPVRADDRPPGPRNFVAGRLDRLEGLRPAQGELLTSGRIEARARGAPEAPLHDPRLQNPAGVTLSLERRGELVELARRHGFLVIE